MLSIEEILRRASVVFGEEKTEVSRLDIFDTNKIKQAEEQETFSRVIVGSSDVSIAALIEKLKNSDWVKQGKGNLENADNLCPFCQKPTDEKFRKELEDYFDESYLLAIEKLKNDSNYYKGSTDTILSEIKILIDSRNMFLDIESVDKTSIIIKSKIEKNMIQIERKLIEPSVKVILESITKDIEIINSIIITANEKIADHNNLIKNKVTEKKKLTENIWHFLAVENAANHSEYSREMQKHIKAIEGMTKRSNDQSIRKTAIKKEIEELEEQITSVVPTINEINRILKSFGFSNFRLEQTEVKGGYKIVRENGEDARETLSEGEKTFITFLYFYQLLYGSKEQSGIVFDRIVVFDDPISSLDCNVLFIVSNLIRKIIEDVRSNTGYVKQVFVLTHNIYFHKEVTFNKGKGTNRLSDETFWILKKPNGISQITCHDSNPIKTSYELLWKELKNTEDRNSIIVQNVMRRIIENYFKILGGMGDEDLLNCFEDEEKITCRSLLSWINDGSHYVNDDLYIDTPDDSIDKYMGVFKKIFEVTNHETHYKMMMNEN